MKDSRDTLRLAFCSGGLAGRLVALPPPRAHVGRSSECQVALTEEDATVSGHHAVLEHAGGVWMVADAGSSTGTFVNGRRIAEADRAALQPGDWVLFGAAGAAAVVLAPGATRPTCWLVLEPEADPGAFVGVAGDEDVRVAVDERGRLFHPAPGGARRGYRFRLDRAPPVAVPLRSARDSESGTRIEAGDVLKLEPGRPGLRVVGLQGRPGAPAFGQTTLRRAIRREIGRRGVLPWALLGLFVAAGVVAALLALDAQETRHQREQVRLERERLRLEQDLEIVRMQFERTLASQREQFEVGLARQKADTAAQLEKLKETERTRFSALLEKYRRSVFLLYVVTRFPDIHLKGGGVLQAAGYGTGWIARADGLLVTNKHVIQAWKFKPQYQAILQRHPDTPIEQEIYAWPAGERFLAADDRPPNAQTGYNSAGLGSLRLLGVGPDEWLQVRIAFGGRQVDTRVHRHADSDLAAIRLTGGPFVPLPVKADPAVMKALDPVMLLGFPLGARVLEAGRCDPSASLGTIRFVRETVAHTASTFPGNSGGPLLSLDGEVVGVLTRAPLVAEELGAETFSNAIRSDSLLRFLERFP